jgi:F-type H+-transporting ATPase subunit b
MARWILLICIFAGCLCADAVRAAEAEHDEEAQASSHEAEKPQVPLEFQGDLALWSAVTFLVFLFVLKQLAWKPLINGMNAREAKIRQEIADAEANRAKSETLFREYEAKLAKAQEEVKGILAEARRDADTAKKDILATAEKESQTMRQRAVSDIERARDQALKELFEVVSQNVMQATERVVGRSLTGADQDRLVKEALASLDLRKN